MSRQCHAAPRALRELGTTLLNAASAIARQSRRGADRWGRRARRAADLAPVAVGRHGRPCRTDQAISVAPARRCACPRLLVGFLAVRQATRLLTRPDTRIDCDRSVLEAPNANACHPAIGDARGLVVADGGGAGRVTRPGVVLWGWLGTGVA